MRVALIGCVSFSEACLRTVAAMDACQVTGVVTLRGAPLTAGPGDTLSLAGVAGELDIPALETGPSEFDDMAAFLDGQAPDLLLCVGWHRLLPDRILRVPSHGVVGYHPAELPNNRGRHPIIWALALGLSKTASTFMLLDSSADTGDIVDQREVPIHDDDDAGTLYARLTEVAQEQLRDLLPKFASGAIQATPQDGSAGNAWRKRTVEDGRIDWRMSAKSIRNLVRALAGPYPGAQVVTDDGPVVVRRCDVGEPGPANLEPGRVLAVDPDGIRIQTGDGTVWLREHTFTRPPPVGSAL